MSAALRSKLVIAGVSAVCACTVGWWLLRARARSDGLRYHWVETPAASAADAAPAAERAPGSMLRRRALTDSEFEQCFSELDPLHERDLHAYFHYRGGIRLDLDWAEHPARHFVATTNGLGLRGAREVRAVHPELRILVTGDSHTDGVCGPEEAFPALLERALTAQGRDAEALNAGVGGYAFYNYLGALERYLPLDPDVLVVAVFGGNDFYEGLSLYHLFEGTSRPASGPEYRERIEQAMAYRDALIAQGPLALHYFKRHPDEIDAALAMASAVSSEIVAACRRADVRPIFVYIPPACDVVWEHHAEPLGRIAQLLELSGDDLLACDHMAERWIAGVRELSVDVLDMRPIFRAQSESSYWMADTHIDLDGHRLIAQALAPLVEAACPRGFERRRASAGAVASAVEPAQAAPDSLRTWRLEVPDQPLARVALDERQVGELFSLRPDQRFDAQALFAYAPGEAINSLGMLGTSEPAAKGGRTRVVLVGDEVLFDRTDASEACGAMLASRGELECLDLTTAGYGPYNYLGAFEKHAACEPDWLAVVWNAGNDFADALDVKRAMARAAGASEEDAPSAEPSTRGTPFDVVARLRERPKDAMAAAKAGVEFALELRRACETRGTKLIVCLVPPATALRFTTAETDSAAAARGLSRSDLDLLGRLSKAFTATLAEHGVSVLDLTDALATSTGTDTFLESMHLAPGARQVVARTLAATIQSAAQRR